MNHLASDRSRGVPSVATGSGARETDGARGA
jgi:hypothetical protein